MDTPRFDVDALLAAPRLTGLALDPDGARLVAEVATADTEAGRYRSALWALDPDGIRPPRRLTRSSDGERAPAFLPDGTLLFASSRPDAGEDEERAGLWALPADGGEARRLAAPPGGVDAIVTATRTTRLLLASRVHPRAGDLEEDTARGEAREKAKVSAQLLTHYPLRHWDHWLGPRERALLSLDTADEGATTVAARAPDARLEETSAALAPEGAFLVTTRWSAPADPRDRVADLVEVTFDDDGAAGPERVVVAEPRVSFGAPAVSPDGTRVAAVRATLGTPAEPPRRTLVIIDLASGGVTDLLPGFDRWPASPVWLPCGSALLFTADDEGHTLPFRVDLADGTLTRLAREGAFAALTAAPDGHAVYALRSTVARPPVAVRLDPATPDQETAALPCPGDDVDPGSRVERVSAVAEDGATVPGWLVRPAEDGGEPAPLVVLIHGGPLSSWSGWHWRWSPHVLAARGWAVLLPDPALSTGYGRDWIARGWGRWGAEPYTDLMALVEATAARPDVDATRVAAAGGSFGGYMANWVAGHTDRFAAIVTHASLWNLEAFHGTTDLGAWWENEFGDRYADVESYRRWSPHRFVSRITTPLLVIHGERDYRVPVGEGLALWTDLRRHGVEAAYLHFPDEHHWILGPQHARLWYETVLAFLDHHVLGQPWQAPELL